MHNFAKQHGFKNKSDTIGHWIKRGIAKMENDLDMHAKHAFFAYQLAFDFVKLRPSKLESMLNDPTNKPQKLIEALKNKSPYESTARHIAYMEDNQETCNMLKGKFPTAHIIFSDRARLKEDEDTEPIGNTSEYFSFSHKKDDDDMNVDNFPRIEDRPACCFCFKLFQRRGKTLADHESFCKKAIESGLAHKIRFKHYKCCCNHCNNGDRNLCLKKESSGEEKIAWLMTNKDSRQLKDDIEAEGIQLNNQKTSQNAREALNKILAQYPDGTEYPTVVNTSCRGMLASHWEAIMKVCDIVGRRIDGHDGQLQVINRKQCLDDFGGWNIIVPLLREKVEADVN